MKTAHTTDDHTLMLPNDQFNEELINNVHPPKWQNPTPSGRYNLVVIGAGTAGLVTAAIASALGAKVALIERHLMGGDCLNVGCVPSKGVIRAAKAWAAVRDAQQFGLHVLGDVKPDFGEAMARMRKLRAKISHVDSAHRYSKLGVDVFIGNGKFTDSDTIEVEGSKLQFSKAVICTGARAAAPPISGLEEAGYLTNETVFSLTALPPRLGIIGAGPIGCEMAQSFARFGSQVFLFEKSDHVLPREDSDAAAIVQTHMKQDGVQFVFDSKVEGVQQQNQTKVIQYKTNGTTQEIAVDEILVGVGRAPNVEGLGLEKVGVEFDHRSGVKVNTRLQTTNPKIFAAGGHLLSIQIYPYG